MFFSFRAHRSGRGIISYDQHPHRYNTLLRHTHTHARATKAATASAAIKDATSGSCRRERLEDGALALDILDVHVQLAALLHAHVLRESGGWPPLGGCARAGLLHHLVDLLEGEALWDGECQ